MEDETGAKVHCQPFSHKSSSPSFGTLSTCSALSKPLSLSPSELFPLLFNSSVSSSFASTNAVAHTVLWLSLFDGVLVDKTSAYVIIEDRIRYGVHSFYGPTKSVFGGHTIIRMRLMCHLCPSRLSLHLTIPCQFGPFVYLSVWIWVTFPDGIHFEPHASYCRAISLLLIPLAL